MVAPNRKNRNGPISLWGAAAKVSAPNGILVSVIREWLGNEIALTKMRLRFARARLSTVARDQFRKGFNSGYAKGYRDAREGLPDASLPYAFVPHQQVDAEGIEVDEGMRDLLVALWKLGLDTQFSCQGEPDLFNPRASRDHAAQIVFASTTDAHRFVKKSAEMFGTELYDDGGLSLATMLPMDSEVPRAAVTFSPRLLSDLTDLWVAFEKTVPTVVVED